MSGASDLLAAAVDSSVVRDAYDVWRANAITDWRAGLPLAAWQEHPEHHAAFAAWLRGLADRVMAAGMLDTETR